MRAAPLTQDDVIEVNAALEAIEQADRALRDLRHRLIRANDEIRSGRLRIAIGRIGEARAIVEHAFR